MPGASKSWDESALIAAASNVVGRVLESIGEPLGGSSRSIVLRVRSVGEPGESLLLKAFDRVTAGDGWAREVTALRVLDGSGVPAPGLIGAIADPPLLLMTDLGAGESLADSLLGRRRDRAADHLTAWAVSLGELHSRTRSLGPAFAAELNRLDAGAEVDAVPEMLETSAESLAEMLVSLDLLFADEARVELTDSSMRSDAYALSPSDACPDNNVEVDGRPALIDFEGATFRHIAWDAAYLKVPWPSCWCSWRLDARAAETALAAWRQAAGSSFPEVYSAEFEFDLAAAETRWAVASTGWFLERALGDDPTPTAEALRGKVPARRAMISHRLGEVVRRSDPRLPALTELAENLLERLSDLWGPRLLELAPAFR